MSSPRVEIKEQTPYFGYVYMWCDMEKDAYYIGSHKGSVYDKYKSGSSWLNSIIKKRPETMKMRILEYYYGNQREELYRLEDNWLKFYDVENNKCFYNFKNQARGGMGPFKHKGKKRAEYTPNWVDHRKGKKIEEIYKDPDAFRKRLSNTAKQYYEQHGHGWKKGKKHKNPLPSKGKTVEEIFGYRKLVNPDKPFIITVEEPFKEPYDIFCLNEREFFEKIKMETTNLKLLKKFGKKEVIKRLPSTKHQYPTGTILYLKFIIDKKEEKND